MKHQSSESSGRNHAHHNIRRALHRGRVCFWSATTGTPSSPFGFTAEQTDPNGLVYLRARYYDPATGVFMSRDPFEGTMTRPMSVNGYSWVEGNVVNAVNPSGMKMRIPEPRLSETINAHLSSGTCISSMPGNMYSNDPCDEKRDRVVNRIKELIKRAEDMMIDRCDQWYQKQGMIVRPFEHPNCYNTSTTWDGHVQQIREKKNNLADLFDDFDNCPDPDNIADTVYEWMGFDENVVVPDREANRRGIPNPEIPRLGFSSISGSINSNPVPDTSGYSPEEEAVIIYVLTFLLLVFAGSGAGGSCQPSATDILCTG